MDTICLKFPYNLPNNNQYFCEQKVKKGGCLLWTNNKWRNEQTAKGLYTPKYWIEEDFINKNRQFFIIEFSAPKMLFNNNLTELKNEHLEPLVEAIISFCRQIKISIFTNQILNARPIVLAIGKNISLTEICSCDLAIKTLFPFDYKPHTNHRVINFDDYKERGKELYFNIKKTETTKFYDKKADIINRAETNKEKELAEQFKNPDCVIEILRFERTFKNSRKISEKFAPYLKKQPPTLKNLFKTEFWDALLKEEVNTLLNNPLQNFMLLATEQRPFIEAYLNKHFKHIQTKNNVVGLITQLQGLGLAKTRQQFLTDFKSRQTWYNYQKHLTALSQQIDWSDLEVLDSFKIHKFILSQFGINNSYQPQLFLTELSKKIDG
jgi:hypothetical protein